MKVLYRVIVAFVIVFGASARAAAPKSAGPTGLIAGEIKDEHGNAVIRYAGVVPRLPGHPTLGLILGLHGKGGDEKQQIQAISQALAASNLSGQFIILGLKAKGESWDDADSEPVAKAVAWAIKEYPIQPRRLYAWGFSSGAFFTGKFVPHHPALMTAGVVQCGGVWDPPKAEDGNEAAAQLYLIHGEKDEMVNVKSAHDACERLTAGNYHFVYRELSGDGHGLNGPGGNPARQDAARFLNSLRNRLIPLSDAEKKTVADLSTKLTEGKVNPPASAYVPLLELAGPETDALIVVGLQSHKPEVRMNTVNLCLQRLYGKSVLDALPALLKDKDAKIRAAAIYSLGLAANFQRKEACDALEALAKDTTAAANDRVNAAGQLGITLPLQLYCVNQDKPMFSTLKELLDDKNSQLKQLAQASLDGKLLPDGQGYKVDR